MSRPKSKIKEGGQISISLPEALIKRIDELAAADNRNRSNFIANTLQNAVKAADAAIPTGLIVSRDILRK